MPRIWEGLVSTRAAVEILLSAVSHASDISFLVARSEAAKGGTFMRRALPFVFLMAAVPLLSSCDQQSTAAELSQACAIVHVHVIGGGRIELRANASPAAMDEAIREWRASESPRVAGDVYFYEVIRVLAVEGCAGK